MKFIFHVSTVLLLLFWLPLARAETKPLKVGAILALTGNNSAYGTSVQNGMILALEKNVGVGKGSSPLTVLQFP